MEIVIALMVTVAVAAFIIRHIALKKEAQKQKDMLKTAAREWKEDPAGAKTKKTKDL